jgi:hypothetical protein
MGLESLLTSPFFYVAVLITVYSIYTKLSRPSTLPSNVPWVGLPDGWFPKIRLWLAGITDGPRLLHLAQQKVGPIFVCAKRAATDISVVY